MLFLKRLYFILLILMNLFSGNDCNGNTNLQSLLNQFCQLDPVCAKRAQSNPTTLIIPTTPEVETHECPPLKLKVPKEIDCGALNSKNVCKIPNGLGVQVQTLICGDGDVSLTCGHNQHVPVMTEIIVQCQDTNTNKELYDGITGVGVTSSDGSKRGAGLYRCMPNGKWVSFIDNSPPLKDLIKSCYFAECGKLPIRTKSVKVDRPWSWVRGFYIDFKISCTATLISPTSALTAAHCVTHPNKDTPRVELLNNPSLELDLPTGSKTLINDISVHPCYTPGERPIFDLAVLHFSNDEPTSYSCIAREITPNNKGIIFEYTNLNKPIWKTSSARLDDKCISENIDLRSVNCEQHRCIPYGQFCLKDHRLSPPPGSSGGPYLTPLNQLSENVWGIMGVLSYSTNVSSFLPDHYIYTDVREVSDWIITTVLKDNEFIDKSPLQSNCFGI